MFNPKLSKTFSTTIITIVTVVFLLPALYQRLVLILMERDYEQQQQEYQQQRDQQQSADKQLIKELNRSAKELALQDAALRDCLDIHINQWIASSPDRWQWLNNDIRNLKNLDCRGKNIRSLKGIEHITGLEQLHLSRNPVEDLSPLARLPQLQQIALPNLDRVYCDDVFELLADPCIQAIELERPLHCIGETAEENSHQRIQILQRQGVTLSHRENIYLMEFEINDMKKPLASRAKSAECHR